jgi:hypothetical protein
LKIPLCGKGFTSRTSFHATYYDVTTTLLELATDINHTGLPTFITKKHVTLLGASNLAMINLIDHFEMVVSRAFIG